MTVNRQFRCLRLMTIGGAFEGDNHLSARIVRNPAFPSLLELMSEEGEVLSSLIIDRARPDNESRAWDWLRRQAHDRGLRLAEEI